METLALPAVVVAPRFALLICKQCLEPTSHRFVRRQPVGQVGDYEQIWGCSQCMCERRYGLFARKVA